MKARRVFRTGDDTFRLYRFGPYDWRLIADDRPGGEPTTLEERSYHGFTTEDAAINCGLSFVARAKAQQA